MSSPDQAESDQAQQDEIQPADAELDETAATTAPGRDSEAETPAAPPKSPTPMGALLAVWAALGLALIVVVIGVTFQSLLEPLRGRE
ncbi:MAG: hypothetical protein Q4F67_00240, partial [Propionibacteriaceae bacterium]|nr:hypothetical protein [Propionibacteriaceae bacterium]